MSTWGDQFEVQYIADPDIWSILPPHTQRFDGYTSAPYRVEFGIENELEINVFPGNSRGFIQFYGNPLTNTDHIYDKDKDVYTGQSTHQKNYYYWLTV